MSRRFASIELTGEPQSNKFFYCSIDAEFRIFAWKSHGPLRRPNQAHFAIASLHISLYLSLFLTFCHLYARVFVFFRYFSPSYTFFPPIFLSMNFNNNNNEIVTISISLCSTNNCFDSHCSFGNA